jgi:hypothetical protein
MVVASINGLSSLERRYGGVHQSREFDAVSAGLSKIRGSRRCATKIAITIVGRAFETAEIDGESSS